MGHSSGMSSTVPDISMDQLAVKATCIDMAPSVSTAHRHQHGFRLKPRPWTSVWLLVVVQATVINTNMTALRPCTQTWPSAVAQNGTYQGRRWQQRPLRSLLSPEAVQPATSTWLQVVATDHGHLCVLLC